MIPKNQLFQFTDDFISISTWTVNIIAIFRSNRKRCKKGDPLGSYLVMSSQKKLRKFFNLPFGVISWTPAIPLISGELLEPSTFC